MISRRKMEQVRDRLVRVRALHALGKSNPEIAEALAADPKQTRLDHRRLSLPLNPPSEEQPIIPAPVEGLIGDRILSALRAFGGWASTTTLSLSLGDRSRTLVLGALARLYRDGYVDKRIDRRVGEKYERAYWKALRVPGVTRPRPGDGVIIRTQDHPALDGAFATVVAVEEWGAHLSTAATHSGRYRATWDEMELVGSSPVR